MHFTEIIVKTGECKNLIWMSFPMICTFQIIFRWCLLCRLAWHSGIVIFYTNLIMFVVRTLYAMMVSVQQTSANEELNNTFRYRVLTVVGEWKGIKQFLFNVSRETLCMHIIVLVFSIRRYDKVRLSIVHIILVPINLRRFYSICRDVTLSHL